MHVNTDLIYQGRLLGFPTNSFTYVPPVPQPTAPFLWGLAPQLQYQAAPVQAIPPQEGMSLGTFLAVGVTVIGGMVLFDAESSKAAKAVAQTALGVSVPFLLNQAFDLQAWPRQFPGR